MAVAPRTVVFAMLDGSKDGPASPPKSGFYHFAQSLLIDALMTSRPLDQSMASLRPLVVICGTTGVGKSKLAIELALRLASPSPERQYPWRGARIINADSMQVYKGMDVITNKVPVAEQQGVEHVLMGFKEPGEQYVVGEWVRDTMRAVGMFVQYHVRTS